MPARFHDMCKMTITSTGTGTITLGTAVAGFQSFASGNVLDQETVCYSISDVSNAWEVGRGIYSSSGTTLTRGPIFSSNSNAAITLTTAALIWIDFLAEEMPPLLVTLNARDAFGACLGACL